MNDKRKNEIDEQMLMNYLEGKLTPEEQHEVESAMMDSPFLEDAVDGLSIITNKQRAAVILDELNRDITQKTISKKEKIKYNHLIPNMQTLILTATITILLMVIIGFVIIKMFYNS